MKVLRLLFALIVLMGFRIAIAAPFADRIVIRKSENILQAVSGDRIVKSYRVSLGRNSSEGPKEREGDERTPEGRYKITAHNKHSDFFYSLRISYPNTADRDRARQLGVEPGGDIMIHGLPDLKSWESWGLPKNWADYRVVKWHYLVNWTAGCIAVTNSEIMELAKLAPVGTEVEIQP